MDMIFIDPNEVFSIGENTTRLKQPVSYKVFGLKSFADVYKKLDGGIITYVCKLQYGGELEIMKIEDKWIDLHNDQPTSLAHSLGDGIDRIEVVN